VFPQLEEINLAAISAMCHHHKTLLLKFQQSLQDLVLATLNFPNLILCPKNWMIDRLQDSEKKLEVQI